jgi:hypothetical protein
MSRQWINEIAKTQDARRKQAEDANSARDQRAEDLKRLLPAFWSEFATEVEAIKDEFVASTRIPVDSKRDDSKQSISLDLGNHWAEIALLPNAGQFDVTRMTPDHPMRKSIKLPPLKVVGGNLLTDNHKSARDFANEFCEGFFKTATK